MRTPLRRAPSRRLTGPSSPRRRSHAPWANVSLWGVLTYALLAMCGGFTYIGRSVAYARGKDKPFEFEIPPPPAKARPRFAFDVHTGFSAPLNHRSLCPPDAGCVMQNGGGVGGSVERRWPSGFGLVGAYDLWFLDTDSVYELGVEQILRAGFRYTMPTDIVFHPVFEVTGGAMIYGDTFRAATAGAHLQLLGGAEIELTPVFGIRLGFGLRVFSHSAFRTERDGVLRGNHGIFSESFYLEVGLTFW